MALSRAGWITRTILWPATPTLLSILAMSHLGAGLPRAHIDRGSTTPLHTADLRPLPLAQTSPLLAHTCSDPMTALTTIEPSLTWADHGAAWRISPHAAWPWHDIDAVPHTLPPCSSQQPSVVATVPLTPRSSSGPVTI